MTTAEPTDGAATVAPRNRTRQCRPRPSRRSPMPRRDCAVNLRLARRTEKRPHRVHQVNGGCALDRSRVRLLVMGLALPKRQDTASEEGGNSLDDVAIRHRNANEREARTRWAAAAEGSLSLEDANEPVKFRFVYEDYLWSSGGPCQWDRRTGRLRGLEPRQRGPQPLVLPLHHSRRGSNASAFDA